MDTSPQIAIDHEVVPARPTSPDRFDVVLLALTLAGVLMLGGWGFFRTGSVAVGFASAGAVIMPLGSLVLLLRHRRRTILKHGIRQTRILGLFGYLSNWGACGTVAFVSLQIPRICSPISLVDLSSEDAERVMAGRDTVLATMQVGLMVMLAFLILMILDMLHLQSLSRKRPSQDATRI